MSPTADSPPLVPAATVPPPVPKDFPDWLSPMIVKELRQGTRTAVFIGSFIALQAILVMLLAMSATTGNNDGATMFFWGLVAFILVFIIPLRGFNALAGELKAQTLDMLALTRLSAWRIAFGKWLALVLQGLLIAVSVMPYVVMRYYGGGVEVFSELRLLVLLLLLSSGVCALAVCFSGLPSIVLRTLLVLGTWWASAMACGGLVFATTRAARAFGGLDSDLWSTVFLAGVPCWLYVCYFALDLGATCIAPAASNHATRKRLISAALLAVSLGVLLLSRDSDVQGIAMLISMGIWALASLDCLTEAPTAAPSVYVPFVRLGPLGRLAAWLLSPGWATGLLYYLVITTPCCLTILYREAAHRVSISISTDDMIFGSALLILVAASCPLVALAYALTFRDEGRTLLPRFVSGAIIATVVGLFCLFMTETLKSDVLEAAASLLPVSAFIIAVEDGQPHIFPLLVGVASGFVFLAFVRWKARVPFAAMRQAMREAAATPVVDRRP